MKKSFLVLAYLLLATFVFGIVTASAQRGRGEGKGKRQFHRQWDAKNSRFDFNYTEEEEQEALEFIKSISEERYNQIKRVKYSNDRRYGFTISMTLRKKVQIEEMKESNPEMAEVMLRETKLFTSVSLLTEKYKKEKSEDEKKKVKDRLRKLMPDWFEIRLSLKEYEIKQLEDDILNLKEELDYRKKNKDEIIEKQLNRFLESRRRRMDWD